MQEGKPVRASEICEELGITSLLLTEWRQMLNLPEKAHGRREIIYSWGSFLKLQKLAENKDKLEEERRKKRKGIHKLPANIEELQRDHPLVKDPRCLSWNGSLKYKRKMKE